MPPIDNLRQSLNRLSQDLGNLLVDAFHSLALFAIGATIVWSAVFAFVGMTGKGHASIDGILLLAVANLVIRCGSAKFPATEPGAK